MNHAIFEDLGPVQVRKRRSSRFVAPRRRTVFVTLVVLAAIGLGTFAAGVAHRRITSPAHRARVAHIVRSPQKARYLVLMVLDGARPDYFEGVNLPHLQALRARGTVYTDTFDGILESETPSGHTTLATGSTPAHNGILGFDWKQNNNDYSLFSPAVVRAGVMERIMQQAGVPTIAGLFKARYPHAAVVALSGHKYYAADPLGGPDADAIMYYQGDYRGHYVPVAIPDHMPPSGILDAPNLVGKSSHEPFGTEDQLATRLALATFSRMHQRITLINYPEFDWPLGHVDGGKAHPRRVQTLMRGLDADLGRIEAEFRKAGILDQTLFVITADHGMGPLHRFVPDTVIARAVEQAGTTAPAISYNTGVYVWLRDDGKARPVAENIMAARDPGIYAAYYLSGSQGSRSYYLAPGSSVNASMNRANLFLLRTLQNGHEPAVVAFCRPGQSAITPTTGWRGDHGGSDWNSQHIPLILAGPGIRQGYVSSDPAQLDDIAPTALTALDVPPTGMEGRVLSDALLHSTKLDRRARQKEIEQIEPIAEVLKAAS